MPGLESASEGGFDSPGGSGLPLVFASDLLVGALPDHPQQIENELAQGCRQGVIAAFRDIVGTRRHKLDRKSVV